MNVMEMPVQTGVRTVLHLSPAVCAAAMSAAQQSGLSLQEWLDHRVSYAMADDNVMLDRALDAVAPWSLAAAELFVQVANGAPEALRGRWALLYERVRLERSLWYEPTQTVEEIEAGAPFSEPYISLPKLRAVWPRLCAATFCV
ncbi:hypothetical protein [Ralstonia solanacearum]|uniref:hypothetical protein n=1 Tax=Ralstonia solanacearum TaxID=305 RepID=UPI0005AC5B9E|nr:hypothetical protein [Ralstonia solanacearum]MCL9828034.1 hypothetical protein [Ralstonia solanacearum]MCL9832818.1 hypothetical protein [Ralstonia solanacearum]MCL9837599.1 hypothetical protein [Ralstonia solanacearum]OAI70687.1 hypothetical protein RSP797_14130 [Ralstonia solanacearum]